MRESRQPVTFTNARGERLFGIVHEPVERRSDVAVVLLSPGVKNRVAPHRLYNKMADRFVRLGFVVLRFDFYGLGDSEGTVDARLLADLYGSIQVGRYVDDTKSAIAWLRRTYGVTRVVVGGLCGGAITGLLAAPAQVEVAGVLALGLPVMLDGSNVDKVRFMTTGQLRSVRGRYLRKALSPSAWWRLLTFKSNLRLLTRAMAVGIPSRPTDAATAAKPGTNGASAATAAPANDANPHFPVAFERTLARRCPVLLVFSESDRLFAEFREKYLAAHAGVVERHADLIEQHVIRNANHVFTFTEWQADMLDVCSSWLERTYVSVEQAASGIAAIPLKSQG